jgi:hypothetical protein
MLNSKADVIDYYGKYMGLAKDKRAEKVQSLR